MRNYIIMTIGNRDVQTVIRDTVVQRRLKFVKKELEKIDLGEQDIFDSLDIKERKKPLKEPEIIGKCYPMLDRTMAYLAQSEVKEIDCMFIICTSRDQSIREKLDLLYDISPGQDDKIRPADYIINLQDHIENDFTFKFAEDIRISLEKGKLSYPDTKIKKVKVLALGSYGYLAPVLGLNGNEKIPDLFRMLSRADINSADFFEYELYHALKPYFQDLNGERIFSSTFAGGMPLMQRAVEFVLKSCLSHFINERIYQSECSGIQMVIEREAEPIEDYLSLLQLMTHHVLTLNWDAAYDCLKKAKGYNKYHGRSAMRALEKVFSEVQEHSASSEVNYFERFAALLWKALYQHDINDVIVWIKCLEEASYKRLLKSKNTLWHKASIEKMSVVPIDKKDPVPANYPDCLLYSFRIAGLKLVLKDYVSIFLDPDTFKSNEEWRKVNSLRNDLVHSGISAVREEELVLDFLRIDKHKLNKAIRDLADKNLDSLKSFEAECMNSRFFKPLRIIAGFTQSNYMLYERKKAEEYLELVLKL